MSLHWNVLPPKYQCSQTAVLDSQLHCPYIKDVLISSVFIKRVYCIWTAKQEMCCLKAATDQMACLTTVWTEPQTLIGPTRVAPTDSLLQPPGANQLCWQHPQSQAWPVEHKHTCAFVSTAQQAFWCMVVWCTVISNNCIGYQKKCPYIKLTLLGSITSKSECSAWFPAALSLHQRCPYVKCPYKESWLHLVVEVVKEAQHAMLIIRVCFIDVLQQLDLIQTLVKVVFVVLQSAKRIR